MTLSTVARMPTALPPAALVRLGSRTPTVADLAVGYALVGARLPAARTLEGPALAAALRAAPKDLLASDGLDPQVARSALRSLADYAEVAPSGEVGPLLALPIRSARATQPALPHAVGG